MLITLATKDTEETVRDAQSCAPSRFENFLRDGGHHRLGYCRKGLDVVAAMRQLVLKRNLKMLVLGIEPRTSRFEAPSRPIVGSPRRATTSIAFSWKLQAQPVCNLKPPQLSFSPRNSSILRTPETPPRTSYPAGRYAVIQGSCAGIK